MMTRTLAIVLVAAAAASAHAQPSAEAKKLYLDGKAHYDVAEYAEAIAKWKQAYVISKAPMLLFNIAQAYRLSGDCTQALRAYATYEREAPKPIANAEELSLARGRCDRAPTNANPPDGIAPSSTSGTGTSGISATKPSGTGTSTTGTSGTGTSGTGTDRIATTPHHDEPTTADPEGGANAHATPTGVDAINEPPTPPELHASNAGKSTQYLGLGIAGAGVALVVTGYLFGRAASSHADEVSAYIGEWTQTQADLASTGQRDATIGKAFAIGGAAAIVGGAVLFGLGVHTHARAELALSVTPSTSEVAWRVHF